MIRTTARTLFNTGTLRVLGIVLLAFTATFMHACAPSAELMDEQMEERMREAEAEYADLSRKLEEMARMEEPDEEFIRQAEPRLEQLMAELPELPVSLQRYRSRLSDIQLAVRNEVPPHFHFNADENRQQSGNRGFRIQILSTQDARFADDLRRDFDSWIRDVSSAPYPHSYLEFQAPYYRVHIGDFTDRNKATEFNQFVRLRYPEAWVVHSRIQPARVADY